MTRGMNIHVYRYVYIFENIYTKARIPRLQQRLICIVTKGNFRTRLEDLESARTVLCAAVSALQGSEIFLRVLEVYTSTLMPASPTSRK